jgi:histidyl-tRNA synthetase
VLLGGSELAIGVVAVKDLVTGEQTEMTQEELIEMMKD